MRIQAFGRVDGLFDTRSSAASRTDRAWLLAYFAALLGLAPLFVDRVAPLQDWPSHLARVQVIADVMAGHSAWSRFYELNSFLLPNTVLDAVVLALLKLGLGIDLAGQAFLLLLYLVFVAGFLRLAASFDALGPLKLMLAVLLFYNGALFYGLVNFQFGLGLLMLFAGSWLRSGPVGKLALATLGTLAVFECHLVAAFLYVGILGSFDLNAIWQSRGRSLFGSISPVALGVVVTLLLWSPTAHDGFLAVWDDADHVASFVGWKARLFIKILLGGSLQSDIVLFAGGAAVTFAAAVCSRVRVSLPVLLLAATTFGLTVAAPGHLGAGSLLDYRIAIVPWLLLGAGIVVSPRGLWGGRVLLSLVFLTLLARAAALAVSWRAADAEMIVLERVMAGLPRDSVLLVGRGRIARDVNWQEFWAFPYNTIPTYAVRYGVFVPSVYANPAQQPLVLKPAYRYFSDFNDVSTPALLEGLQRHAAVRTLCADFPAGVAMVVLFPTPAGLPGMVRVGSRFGLVNMCAVPRIEG